jgi:methanogenic corrinoid protein MtbC1
MDMVRFETILNTQIRRLGVEETMEGLVFQFLEKIGLMWMASHLAPAQEHLASNVLYRKLATAIDGLPFNTSGKKVMLFLPEGEIHEMGLMYVQYLLRKGGKTPIYLGANTPFKEVQWVFEAVKPDYVYTHLTAVAKDWDAGRYLKKLAEVLGSTPLMVSGGLVHKKMPASIKNVTPLMSLAEVRTALAAL